MILQHEKKEQAVIAPDLSQMTELGRQRYRMVHSQESILREARTHHNTHEISART
jgi:hypothetical protein